MKIAFRKFSLKNVWHPYLLGGLMLSIISSASAATGIPTGNRSVNAKTDCAAKGNGTADDTVALQKCIDIAGRTGQALYLPPGRYMISSTLSISKDDTAIYGDNRATTTIVQKNQNADTLYFSKPTGNVINRLSVMDLQLVYGAKNPNAITINCNNCFRAVFRDLFIGGSGLGEPDHLFSYGIWATKGGIIYVEDTSFSGAAIAGAVFVGTDEVNMSNVQINLGLNDLTSYGLILDGPQGGTYLNQVNITAGGTGILMHSTTGSGFANSATFGFFNSVLCDNQNGWGMVLENAKYTHISNSWAASSKSAGGIKLVNTDSITISDTRILNNSGVGIEVGPGAVNTMINGNRITGNSAAAPGVYAGVEVKAGASRFQIQNNDIGASGGFANSQKYGIEVRSGAGNNYMITGNYLQSNVSGGLLDGATGETKVVANNL